MKVILITDRVPPAHDNIGAYACHLAAALRDRGCQAEVWTMRSRSTESLAAPVLSFVRSRSGIGKLYHVVRALGGHEDCTVLWQYNPFSYGRRGLPSLIHLLPLALKAFVGCRVAILFHEICYPFGRDPRSWVWAPAQRIALWFSLLGSDVLIATTRPRRAYLEGFVHRFLPGLAGHFVYAAVPVGSNIPAEYCRVVPRSDNRVVRLGAFRPGQPSSELNLLHRLYQRLRHGGQRIQLLLIGGGPPHGLGRLFQEDDDQPGIVESGYLLADAVSRLLRRLDVFMALYPDGISSRRTSLAAAFAHGLCVVSTAGPTTDCVLFRDGENCVLAPYGDVAALEAAVQRLIRDVDLRAQLGRRALETYQQEMTWPVVANRVLAALQG
jgi:glycosyltransferase involved in cell wall biosynthesis